MRKTSALACALSSTLIVLGLAPTASAAAPVRCGDTITSDVVLTKNLNCAGDGLRVAAGVTVDLNGHRLRGNGTGVGISVGARGPVTIKNGRVENFDVGVENWDAVTRLHRLTLTGNTWGTRVQFGRVDVTDSTFTSNRTGFGHAFHATVTGSTFRNNGTGIMCSDTGLLIRASRFIDNGYGLNSTLCGVVVDGARFNGGDVGAFISSVGYGFDVRNSIFRGAGVGMQVRMPLGGPRVIANNQFTGNGGHGLQIDTDYETSGIEVRGNTFARNGSSGVRANTGTFTGNTAIRNAGHGIEGYGVTDGGGNTASGNGLEPQCVGVTCTPARGAAARGNRRGR